MTTTTGIPAPRTLLDLLPKSADRNLVIARDAVLVIGFAVLTAVCAQFTFKLSFTPVPITGGTFAVLLAGATLGTGRGTLSMSLYWLVGMVMPFAWFQGGGHGWEAATGVTGGYLVGYIAAAALVGYLAERKQDRNFASSISAMLLGSVIIYVLGVAWLKYDLNVPWHTNAAVPGKTAMAFGVTPFLIGDLIKLTLAAAVTPAAWKLFGGKSKTS